MNPSTRRTFLARGSLGVALASALALVPGLGAALRLPLGPVTSGTRPSIASMASTAEPLIVHVRDVSSGEITLLFGTKRVIYRDADLAARLYAAAGRAR